MIDSIWFVVLYIVSGIICVFEFYYYVFKGVEFDVVFGSMLCIFVPVLNTMYAVFAAFDIIFELILKKFK